MKKLKKIKPDVHRELFLSNKKIVLKLALFVPIAYFRYMAVYMPGTDEVSRYQRMNKMLSTGS